MTGTLKNTHFSFYLSPINYQPFTQSAIFCHMISAAAVLLLLSWEYVHFQWTRSLNIPSPTGRSGTIKVFFPLVATMNHVICVPMVMLLRSSSLTWGNLDSDLIKLIVNTSSETQNSELVISEIGKPEFSFNSEFLKPAF